jgi:hypothetical protein
MRTLIGGLIAGAAGTTALNAATYVDMVVRARPASSTPQESIRRLAALAHVDLGEGEPAQNRVNGLAPLLGYLTGVGTAVGYAACRRRDSRASALVLAGLAMVAANAPLTLLRITDPRHWSASDWVSDALPHLAYGAVTAAALNRLR